MNYAAKTKPAELNTRVTTCFSGTVLQNSDSPWVGVVQNCQAVVYLTVYPWYGQSVSGPPDPGNIRKQMDWSWDNGLKQVVAQGKAIVVAEIGWPSQGGFGTSPANEKVNYATTKSFLSGQTAPHWALDTYWFEMFDEPWKTDEGAYGPYWGLYTSGSDPKSKFGF
jgi:hypothetical protein